MLQITLDHYIAHVSVASLILISNLWQCSNLQDHQHRQSKNPSTAKQHKQELHRVCACASKSPFCSKSATQPGRPPNLETNVIKSSQAESRRRSWTTATLQAAIDRQVPYPPPLSCLCLCLHSPITPTSLHRHRLDRSTFPMLDGARSSG